MEGKSPAWQPGLHCSTRNSGLVDHLMSVRPLPHAEEDTSHRKAKRAVTTRSWQVGEHTEHVNNNSHQQSNDNNNDSNHNNSWKLENKKEVGLNFPQKSQKSNIYQHPLHCDAKTIEIGLLLVADIKSFSLGDYLPFSSRHLTNRFGLEGVKQFTVQSFHSCTQWDVKKYHNERSRLLKDCNNNHASKKKKKSSSDTLNIGSRSSECGLYFCSK